MLSKKTFKPLSRNSIVENSFTKRFVSVLKECTCCSFSSNIEIYDFVNHEFIPYCPICQSTFNDPYS
jgi:hypothetical protein